ncbi:hypothetical protein QBC37DRAFT_398839 [Rhypophila decipiens]|uniref:Uncharacterized protein n=1 Tax=Rhypophila decipiens TaxID=261697 RepID=A0AAN7B756_9PEZI|nr:hypothetical protein QBC37DRAFT_398839 [Rhypophila decipiens]
MDLARFNIEDKISKHSRLLELYHVMGVTLSILAFSIDACKFPVRTRMGVRQGGRSSRFIYAGPFSRPTVDQLGTYFHIFLILARQAKHNRPWHGGMAGRKDLASGRGLSVDYSFIVTVRMDGRDGQVKVGRAGRMTTGGAVMGRDLLKLRKGGILWTELPYFGNHDAGFWWGKKNKKEGMSDGEGTGNNNDLAPTGCRSPACLTANNDSKPELHLVGFRSSACPVLYEGFYFVHSLPPFGRWWAAAVAGTCGRRMAQAAPFHPSRKVYRIPAEMLNNQQEKDKGKMIAWLRVEILEPRW